MRGSILEAWANKAFVSEDSHVSVTANGHAIGMCEAYKNILDVTADDLFGDDDE